MAKAFLAEIASAEQRQFASVGHGTDYRYRTRSGPSTITPQPSTICGSALVHENEVIHAAFFRLEETEQPEHMASLRNRHRHFSESTTFKKWSRLIIKCIASAARTH